MRRIIFHVDVNSAFLSWSAVKKLKEEPGSVDLRTIPSAVGGDVKTRHGVITAKSIPAKKFGIRTGEPVMTALRKCPELVTVPSDFKTYREYSAAFIKILQKYAPVVEQASIDEAFLDMSQLSGGQSPEAVAEKIKNEIRDTLGFTVNVGISENRLLAKMASDFEKPDRIHTLWPEEVPEKMWPLPINSLFGCGGATARRLSSFGIRTIGDAANTDLSILQAILGEKAGAYIHRSARGVSSSRVDDSYEDAKSYSNETTTAEDITEENYAEALPPVLKRLSGKVAGRMQRDRVAALTIGVMVKTSDFRRRSRQITLHDSTSDAGIIFRTAEQLMEELLLGEEGIFSQGLGVRLVGVSAANLDNGTYRQLSLFDLPAPEEEPEAGIPAPAEEPAPAPEAEPEAVPAASAYAPETEAGIPAPAEAPEPAAHPEKEQMKKARLDDMMNSLNRRYGKGTLRKGIRT